MKEILGSATAIGFVIGAMLFGGYHAYSYFAPKYESVRRDVMIESRAYSEASVRELYRLKRQWDATDDASKRATIVAAARHEFSIFPEDRLPADLRLWMSQIN